MTVKELRDKLEGLDPDAMVMTATKRMYIDEANYAEDAVLLKSLTEEFTTKVVIISE